MFGFGGSVLDAAMSIPSMMHAEEMQNDAQMFNRGEALESRAFSERMSNTSYQRAMSDMRAAGLNPMLVAKTGGADSGQTSAASSGITRGDVRSNFSGGALAQSQIDLNSASVAKVKAEEIESGARTSEIQARTPTHGQSIAESVQRIQKMIAEVEATRQSERTSAAQELNYKQHTVNMKETVEVIRMTVSQLRQQTMLTGAQSAEVQQRINANLPRLEGLLKDLERSIVEMSLPGHRNAEAAADSFLGQLKAFLHGLIPLQGIIGSVPLGRGGSVAPKYKPSGAYSNPPR